MLEAGIIEESIAEVVGRSRRSRIVYALTAKGSKRFADLAGSTGPESWDDESFEVRFAFFGPTPKNNRLQILEGRLRRLSEKSAILRNELEKAPAGIDKYLAEWRRHSLESSEREIAWLEEMINTERKSS
jgi:DNA-binding PadR family transcriptional regulator